MAAGALASAPQYVKDALALFTTEDGLMRLRSAHAVRLEQHLASLGWQPAGGELRRRVEVLLGRLPFAVRRAVVLEFVIEVVVGADAIQLKARLARDGGAEGPG